MKLIKDKTFQDVRKRIYEANGYTVTATTIADKTTVDITPTEPGRPIIYLASDAETAFMNMALMPPVQITSKNLESFKKILDEVQELVDQVKKELT